MKKCYKCGEEYEGSELESYICSDCFPVCMIPEWKSIQIETKKRIILGWLR